MTAMVNFGTTLKKDNTSLGVLKSLSAITVTYDQLDVTNHASASKEFISGPWGVLNPFTAELIVASGVGMDTLYALAGTLGSYTIQTPAPDTTTFTFSANVSSVERAAADAQSIAAEVVVIGFQPTGTFTVA